MGGGAIAMGVMTIGHRYAPIGKSSSARRGMHCRADAAGTRSVATSPVYSVTTSDRATRTPHSGYHFDGSSRRFFEGWYFKVCVREAKQGFAWMYSVEDPGSPGISGGFEELITGPRFPGVGAQVMGANDEYIYHYDTDVETFWGSRHELALGHTFKPKPGKAPPSIEVNPKEFNDRVEEGFQVTPTWHQGYFVDNGKSSYVKTRESVRWEYSTKPIYGWGDVGGEQTATAGWLAALPVFEPHWQVCMAAGLSTGWIEWGDRRFEFENAPSYSEKNWGGSFPTKWFWVQCNVFDGVSEEVALTAGGGRRGLPLVPGVFEEVAMVGVHFGGKFYEFVPWSGIVEWDIAPWGSWKMSAESRHYKVQVEATTDARGVILRAPTSTKGLAPFCKDTFYGNLRLRLWERCVRGPDKVILDVTSDSCALEVGGAPWYSGWQNSSQVQEPVKSLLGLPVNVGKVFDKAPHFKPPGL